jgi:predicted RNase H-related nuclease YkuK (DUF458 family)
MEDRVFISKTYGRLTQSECFELIADKMRNAPDNTYQLFVGTDSQVHQDDTKVVPVIVMHKIGNGAIYFANINNVPKFHSLRERIYYEASQSIVLGKELMEYLFENDLDFRIIIDIDIGRNGKTSELISELVGYAVAEGFEVRIKPDSMAAMTVADRLSK